MARTRWYINEDLGVYPWDKGSTERNRQFPNDAATRWGGLGYLTEEAAENAADEWDRYLKGEISECVFEFGEHDDHSDCDRILADMSPEVPDETDYSGWYGGERGYNDGLRWSDFI